MFKNKEDFFLFFSVTVVMAATLIFAELMARSLFPPPIESIIPSKNFRLIYELNPKHPEINSLGMRQEEIDLATLHDNFVIAVIGDSHTYSGHSPNRENTYPARLEHHLKAITGKKIKVLNFGVWGYNMAQELEVLRAKALRFKPDLVILQYCINDEHISNYIQPKYIWLNRALYHSTLLTRAWTNFLYSEFGNKHVLPFVEKYMPDLLLYIPGLVGTQQSNEKDPAHAPHPPRSKDQVPARYHDFIGRGNLERDVKIFGDLCIRAGIPVLATGFIEEKDRAIYETSGFKVLSFFQMFFGLDISNYGYDPSNTASHFTDQGSDLIGKALAVYIGKNFL